MYKRAITILIYMLILVLQLSACHNDATDVNNIVPESVSTTVGSTEASKEIEETVIVDSKDANMRETEPNMIESEDTHPDESEYFQTEPTSNGSIANEHPKMDSQDIETEPTTSIDILPTEEPYISGESPED